MDFKKQILFFNSLIDIYFDHFCWCDYALDCRLCEILVELAEALDSLPFQLQKKLPELWVDALAMASYCLVPKLILALVLWFQLSDMNGKMVISKPLFVALAQRKEDRKARLQVHAIYDKFSCVPFVFWLLSWLCSFISCPCIHVNVLIDRWIWWNAILVTSAGGLTCRMKSRIFYTVFLETLESQNVCVFPYEAISGFLAQIGLLLILFIFPKKVFFTFSGKGFPS